MSTIADLRNNPEEDIKSDSEFKQDHSEPAEKQPQSVSLAGLYRFTSGQDYCLITIGIVFSLVSGCCLPSFAYLWGKVLDMFLLTNDAQERINIAIDYRNIFFYVGLGALASSWIAFASWTVISERMAVRCRKAFMKSLLRQDVGWFDTQNQYQLSSNFNADALAYQKATGEKINSMLYLLAMFLCGLIIAIIVGWKMALVISPNLPIVGIVMVFFIYIKNKKKEVFLKYSEQADSRSHQALSTIKTVKSLNGEQFEEKTYSSYLQLLKEQVPKWSLYDGIGTGLFFFIQYCAFSFSYWYGTHCVGNTQKCQSSEAYTPGQATIVFFAISIGCYNFMPLLPNLSAIIQGMKAAGRLYAIIDQEPTIDTTNNCHDRRDIKGVQIRGHLAFDRVTFAFPSNKKLKVLSRISLEARPGSKIALVGDSGCGKSTVVQLLMRFYDPDEGKVTLDGVDLKDYNLHWLRSQIGYVGQEPSLFEGTILDNIRIGKSDASVEEVTDALRAAEALEFVNSLPDQLNYNVGYAGSHLSGGQKQRIAIARALVRKPKLLVLDEATSALDRRNEKLIQNTLQKISQGITTLTVAHRVKTIMNTDHIYVIQSGTIVEQGKFKELKRFQSMEIDIDEDQVANDRKYQDKNRAEIINEPEPRLDQVQYVNHKYAEQQQQEYRGSVFSRLFSYTEGNRSQLFTAIVSAIISGAVHPAGALLLANIMYRQFKMYPISKVSPDNPNVALLISEAENYALWLFLLSIFIFFCFSIQSVLFTRVGEAITERVRKDVYHKLLRLPVQWFHRTKNRGGAAATRFAADSRQVNSLLSSLLSTLLMNFSEITVGMVLAFVFEWRLGIVGIVAIPCMVAAGFISMLFVGGFGDKSKQHYEKSAKISEEAILNIRTVYSCGYQASLGKVYDSQLQKPLDESFWTGSWLGILYGSSQLILQFTFGCLFYFNALIMRDHPEVALLDIFYSNMVIIWAGWYAGNNFYFMPDVVSSRQAAHSLFQVLDEEDEMQLQEKSGSRKLKTPILGDIQVKNLSFKYNPQDENVINNINFTIKKGEKVAFVGPSGSGKSTIFQLLQRFYDFNGEIFLDGVEIRDYDIQHLRSHLVPVNQEPSLFTGTFGSNIKYNVEADEAQLTEAAINAEALSFINSKQKRFESEVGVMGTSLSGGQKQRVAIARGLIRRPQIMILDEATSALDRETEKKVQANVDRLMRQKTSLVIAHRIETIVNSDRIYVFDKGEILEEGSYQQLTRMKRHFYNLERGEKMKNQ